MSASQPVSPLLVRNPHFETLLDGVNPAYEAEIPGQNPSITRSYIVTGGTVTLAFPAGTTFENVAAVANAPAHKRAMINGVVVILPADVEPWTGDRVVSLELRVNTVEPKNITRQCYRNYRFVLDNVRPVSGKSNGRMVIEAARDSKITVIRDGMMIHNGGCLKFPTTGEIPDTSKRRGPSNFDQVHAPERGRDDYHR